MLSVTLRLRAAQQMQKAWDVHARQTGHDQAYALHRLDEAQRNLQRARYQLDKARGRGLTLAAAHLEANLRGSLKALQEAAGQARQVLERPAPAVPDMAFLLAEIRQLEDEFDEVQIDWDERFVGATTEPITLEGVYLGAFAIRLHWERLARRLDAQCFDVVALDPNPAATDDRVTHPHVKDNTLCAGDATVPLKKALEQGRLADAFCLIRGVLTHYHAGSPHVALDAWDGTSCQDCGRTVCDDDCCSCGGCDDDYCYDCTRSCAACDATRCLDCLVHDPGAVCSPRGGMLSRPRPERVLSLELTGPRKHGTHRRLSKRSVAFALERCAVCEADHCAQCLQACASSGKNCCSGCLRACAACGAEVAHIELDAETERCPSCRAPEQDPEGDSDTAAPNPPSSLQPLPSEDVDVTLEPLPPAAV